MNRRLFLRAGIRGVGAGALAGLMGTTGCAGGLGGSRLRLSTSSNHFRSLPLEDAVARIASLGFEAIDVWGAYEGCPHLDDAATRLGGEGLRSLLHRHGLGLCAFSTYVGGYAKYARLLGEMGGGVAIQGSAGPCAPAELGSRMRRFFEELKPLAALAEEHRSWLAIENHGHALLDGLDSFRAFVETNPYPRVGLALAPYHLQALGASVPEAIRIAGRQLLFFYAWQNAPGLGQLPGVGPTDFRPWLSALADIRYRRHVNPFMHGHVDPEAMASALGGARQHLLGLS